MKFEVEDVSSVRKKITVFMPKEKVNEKIDSAYNRIRKSAKIKGFRPGKAPRNVLEKHYKGQVLEEVQTNLVQESYPKVISDEGIVPVSYPEFDGSAINEGEDYSFSLSVDVKPKVKPKGYEGIKLEKGKVEVSDEELSEELENIRKKLSTFAAVEGRAVQKGDVVTFDFEGFVGGEPIEKGKAENYTLEIGSGQFIPGFEDGIVGMNKGDSGDIKVKFPDDYNSEELAGKDAIFKIVINEIKCAELPELDDEFAKDAGSYESLDELKTKISENIKASKEDAVKRDLQVKLVDTIVEKNPIEVPQSMIDRQVQNKMEETRKQMSAYGMPADEVEKNIDAVKDRICEDAEKQVKSMILLEAVAEKEKVSVEDADINAYYDNMSEKTGRPSEEIKKFYQDKKDYLEAVVLDEKIIDFLMSKAKITEKG